MRLAKQLYIRDFPEGWKGVFSPFGNKVLFLTAEEMQLINEGRFNEMEQEILDYLKENNVLVEEGFERSWLKQWLRLPGVNFSSMFLITTTVCNLACKYCVVLGNENLTAYPKEFMSVETGRKAVEKFAEHLRKHRVPRARVTFYGGEPTLNKELLFDIIPRISAIDYPGLIEPVEAVIITNAYEYDHELAQLLKEHLGFIGVSMDGMKKHQDSARVTTAGEPTYDRVIENIRKYQADGIIVNITATMGKHNIEDIAQIAEFFATEVKPNLVEFQTSCDVPGSNPYFVNGEIAARKLFEAYQILKSHGIVEGTTYRRLGFVIPGDLLLADCGSAGAQLVVAPDGMMGPCHSLVGSRTYFAGNVHDPECDPVELPNFVEWANRYPLHMPGCHDCSFISLCGGGCTYNSYVTNGSIWQKDEEHCKFIKGFVDTIMEDLWDKTSEYEV